MKIFLTGGAGFIGSTIADSLVAQGHDVIIYDNFSSGTMDNLKSCAKYVRIIEGDILNKQQLLNACPPDVDLISHQAAHLEIFRSLSDPGEDLSHNTNGTINVLETARVRGIRRFINASSACVYGQAEYTPQDEDHIRRPNWPYGASKLAAEEYARIYMETFGIKTVNLRYGIVYGPREWFGRVLTMFLSRVYAERAPVVFGDGSAVRDFIHVSDAVAFHNLCLDNEAAWGKSFNVATGIGTSMSTLAEKVCDILSEGRLRPIYEDIREGQASALMPIRRRIPQELKTMVLSNAFGEKVIGFRPRRVLEEGIQEEFEWYREHPGRWNTAMPVKV